MNTKNSQKCFLKIIKIIFMVFFVGSIAIMIRGIIYPKNSDYAQDSLLSPIDSSKFSSKKEQIQNLKFSIENINQYKIISNNVLMENRGGRMQTRLSFIALLAFLLIPLLKTKNRCKQSGIVLILIIFFLSFYFYDIHIADLYNRQSYNDNFYNIIYNDIIKIINSEDDLFRYDTYEKITKYLNEDNWGNSILRKLLNFFRPDLSQIAFYVLPITIVLGKYLFLPKLSLKKKKKKKRGKN